MQSKVTGCWGEIDVKKDRWDIQYIPMKDGYTVNYPKPSGGKRTKKKNNNGALISLSIVSMIVGLVLGMII